ncbi:MAG: surface carbohydrate biosynthesis protein [Kiloniellales bacterium]
MASRRPRIGLIVDHPRRDLAGLCLVAHRLLARGLEPILVPMYQQGIDVPLLGLDLVVVNYARANNRALLQTYAGLGLPVFVLDTEGGVLSEDGFDSPDVWAKSARDSGLGALVSRYLFWGERTRDAFVANRALTAEAAQVTGSPRFDFCAPPWRRALDWAERDYVLINTNFSSVNPLLTASAEQERQIFVEVGMEGAYADRLIEATSQAFARYLAAIEQTISANPELSFIIRPHPFEGRALYESRFGRYANVRVRAEGNVLNAIANARCVLHLNCGTAVEANLLGKVPIQLEPINDEILSRHTPLPRQISYNPSSLEDVGHALAHIDEIEAGFDFEGNLESRIRPFFGPLDGRAAERVADAIAGYLKENAIGESPRVSLAAALRSGQPAPSLPQRLQGIVGTVAGSRAVAALRRLGSREKSSKRFTVAEVEAETAAIRQCDPASRPVAVRQARHPTTAASLESVALTPVS